MEYYLYLVFGAVLLYVTMQVLHVRNGVAAIHSHAERKKLADSICATGGAMYTADIKDQYIKRMQGGVCIDRLDVNAAYALLNNLYANKYQDMQMAAKKKADRDAAIAKESEQRIIQSVPPGYSITTGTGEWQYDSLSYPNYALTYTTEKKKKAPKKSKK